MMWFFERTAKRLLYKIRREEGGPGYELVLSYPDGSLRTERAAAVSPWAGRTHTREPGS